MESFHGNKNVWFTSSVDVKASNMRVGRQQQHGPPTVGTAYSDNSREASNSRDDSNGKDGNNSRDASNNRMSATAVMPATT